MKKIHLNRLKKLADHLIHGKLGHTIFHFAEYNGGDKDENRCGTIGCAMGECPIVFPEDFIFSPLDYKPVLNYNPSSESSGAHFFDLSLDEYKHLFIPNEQIPDLGIMLSIFATKEQVVDNMYTFIKLKCKEFSIPFESLNTEIAEE